MSQAIQAGRAVVRDPSSAENKRVFAEWLIRLRETTTTTDGRPDFAGRSPEYRAAFSAICEAAAIPPDETGVSSIRASVRQHCVTIVLQRLREMADGDEAKFFELCEEYKYRPPKTRYRDQWNRNAGVRLVKLVEPKHVAALCEDTGERLMAYCRVNPAESLTAAEARDLAGVFNRLLEQVAPLAAALDLRARTNTE